MKYPRALAMEFIGTALIAVAVVGSGWTAVSVGADQVSGLLINAIATGLIFGNCYSYWLEVKWVSI
jgi:glycerol uptake facilitator-like aquaporin